MRNVVVSVYTTLNGVMSPVDWVFPYVSEERGKYARDLLFEADALVMGRETYESFLGVWPKRTAADDGPGEAGLSDRINSLPKYVVSTTLEQVTWNNCHLIRGNVAEEVANMKQQEGLSILLYGAGPVAHSLMQHGLIDEVRVWMHPLVTGVTEKSKRLFDDAPDIPLLKLVETRTFDSGVVVLSYRPDQTA
jgi:dihydrofolate reductase